MLGLTLAGATGCQTTGSYLLSTIGLQKKPLAMALVLDRPTEAVAALNPFPAYAAMQKAMADHLGRPVAIDPCFVFQARQGLGSGWYAIADVTPAQYAHLVGEGAPRVLAVPIDKDGKTARSALLIVPAASEVSKPEDLRGKKVAFGPADDGRTHYAALQLLREHGLRPTDLSLEALPVPGSLRHMPDMRALAQTVMNGSAAAGFMDESAWDALPMHAEKEDAPAQDRFRVLGRTAELPLRLFVASPRLEAADAEKVTDFLLAAAKDHADVLEPLGVTGYQQPRPDLVTACAKLPVGPAEESPGPSDEASPAKEPGK